MKHRILDGCCCAGGASAGYVLAGFRVTGVDIAPQPHYPYTFKQADIFNILTDTQYLKQFSAIHVSPRCQLYSVTQRIQNNDHPDQIPLIRELCIASGLPWIIENVPGSSLRTPITLCGSMFPELRVYRHREFETSFRVKAPEHPAHVTRQTKMGRPVNDTEFMHVVGNFSGVQAAREAMGIPWMTRDTLREAIPPAYTRYIGQQLLAHLES